jgi:hypothetical protein
MVRERQSKERGGSKMNTLITLAVLGSMVFAGFKIVPVYLANYELQDAIQSESKFALTGYPKKSVDDIRDDVWQKAKDLGIEADKTAVQVEVTNGSVDIGLDYAVPVDLSVYQFTLQFHPHADNHTI